MLLGSFCCRVVLADWIRARVSDIVVAGVEVRSARRDSMAAIGGVREGSEAVKDL